MCVMPKIRMNSLKFFAMNCGPVPEMMRGRTSGYFPLAPLTGDEYTILLVAKPFSSLNCRL